MTKRVTSDFMLVGSLPLESTEDALRAGSELFGDCCFALPDGETGERWLWVVYEAYRLWRPHPQIETVHVPTDSPPGLPDWGPRALVGSVDISDPAGGLQARIRALAAYGRRHRVVSTVQGFT